MHFSITLMRAFTACLCAPCLVIGLLVRLHCCSAYLVSWHLGLRRLMFVPYLAVGIHSSVTNNVVVAALAAVILQTVCATSHAAPVLGHAAPIGYELDYLLGFSSDALDARHSSRPLLSEDAILQARALHVYATYRLHNLARHHPFASLDFAGSYRGFFHEGCSASDLDFCLLD